MALPIFNNLDLNNAAILNFLIDPRASVPGSPVANQIYNDTTLGYLRIRNASNTAWIDVGYSPGAMHLVGEITDANTNPAFPGNPTDGDVYIINTNPGTVGGLNVEVGDQLIHTGGNWFVLQRNLEAATTIVAGFVRLATDQEVIDGIESSAAVSPSALQNWFSTELAPFIITVFNSGIQARRFAGFVTGDGVTTDFEFNHSFNTQTDYHVRVVDALTGETVYTDVVGYDLNNVRISFAVPPGNGVQYRVYIVR